MVRRRVRLWRRRVRLCPRRARRRRLGGGDSGRWAGASIAQQLRQRRHLPGRQRRQPMARLQRTRRRAQPAAQPLPQRWQVPQRPRPRGRRPVLLARLQPTGRRVQPTAQQPQVRRRPRPRRRLPPAPGLLRPRLLLPPRRQQTSRPPAPRRAATPSAPATGTFGRDTSYAGRPGRRCAGCAARSGGNGRCDAGYVAGDRRARWRDRAIDTSSTGRRGDGALRRHGPRCCAGRQCTCDGRGGCRLPIRPSHGSRRHAASRRSRAIRRRGSRRYAIAAGCRAIDARGTARGRRIIHARCRGIDARGAVNCGRACTPDRRCRLRSGACRWGARRARFYAGACLGSTGHCRLA